MQPKYSKAATINRISCHTWFRFGCEKLCRRKSFFICCVCVVAVILMKVEKGIKYWHSPWSAVQSLVQFGGLRYMHYNLAILPWFNTVCDWPKYRLCFVTLYFCTKNRHEATPGHFYLVRSIIVLQYISYFLTLSGQISRGLYYVSVSKRSAVEAWTNTSGRNFLICHILLLTISLRSYLISGG